MAFKITTFHHIEDLTNEILNRIDKDGLEFSIQVTALRRILNCKNKYSTVSDFKTLKLKPLCDFLGISLEDGEKLGRRVTELIFKVDKTTFDNSVLALSIQNKKDIG